MPPAAPTAAPRTGPGALWRWIPVLVWAGFISWFSTGAFSAHSTNHYIDPVLRFLFGELSAQQFRVAHTVVRKSAHFLEYSVLAILLCRALTAPHARITAAVMVRAIVICALYAAADEIHQTFEPDRTGSPIDVLIDASGAVIATLVTTWWRALRSAAAARPVAAVEP